MSDKRWDGDAPKLNPLYNRIKTLSNEQLLITVRQWETWRVRGYLPADKPLFESLAEELLVEIKRAPDSSVQEKVYHWICEEIARRWANSQLH